MMTEYDQTIINRRIGMEFGHTTSRNRFHFTSYPAGIIIIMDHQIHQYAARFLFIEEPVARWFLGPITSAVQTNDTRFTNLSLGDSRTGERVFRKKTNYMCYEELNTRCATGVHDF